MKGGEESKYATELRSRNITVSRISLTHTQNTNELTDRLLGSVLTNMDLFDE